MSQQRLMRQSYVNQSMQENQKQRMIKDLGFEKDFRICNFQQQHCQIIYKFQQITELIINPIFGIMIRDYSVEFVSELMEVHYGLEGKIKELGSETDKNFLLQTSHGQEKKFIIKISNIRENHKLILLQNYVFKQLEVRQFRSKCQFPKIIPSKMHEDMVQITSSDGKNFLRVLSFVEGEELYDFEDPPLHLFDQSGEVAANISLFLSDLTIKRQVMDLNLEKQGQNHAFNLINFNQHYEKHYQYLDANFNPIVTKIKEQFNTILPILKGTPKQLAHHDICLTNLLVDKNKSNGDLFISGLIDFSDIQITHAIIELVILGARINLYFPEPLRNMLTAIKAFDRVRKLSEDEKTVLFPMIKTRLAYLCLTSSYLAAERYNDPYILKCKNGQISYLVTLANHCTSAEFRNILEEELSK